MRPLEPRALPAWRPEKFNSPTVSLDFSVQKSGSVQDVPPSLKSQVYRQYGVVGW